MIKFRIGPIKVVDGKFGSIFVIRPSTVHKGRTNTMVMNGPTAREVTVWLEKKARGEPHALIQNAFPTLNSGEREFLLSGLTPEEWDEVFPKNWSCKMGKRFDVSTPRPKGPNFPGESWWLRVGSAWQNDRGLITIYLDSYPVPDKEGVVKMMLLEPKPQQQQPVIDSSVSYEEAMNDRIPF